MARIIECTVDGVMKTVAPHRLKELQHLQAVEKLATWRTARGFDRVTDVCMYVWPSHISEYGSTG